MNEENTAETITDKPCIWVCQHQSCLRNGSAEVLAAFQAKVGDEFVVEGVGCQGQCNLGPTVRVLPDGVWYCRIHPENIPEIVESHLRGGEPVKSLLHPRLHPQFYY
ncbi:(2Fe-2S) ferredoxin domain-containing protein [Roseofilum casamattae]|uniref:(2Fe-2S) ferredoxin domain-containing protein n=1 Tax=Roseofilum casamattae BLCC-M143 TaxID=3022442 RepID=A0ABT7BUI7_9CYAN|nr:(2Fe-2S) ferredoxin domain-containing protein [Roseofilum casamattae]MDJ1182850.1 (2Fe-2S) ferredoxin domain-containing protein [Roseofilum casamattae BLCC-M143]